MYGLYEYTCMVKIKYGEEESVGQRGDTRL